VEDEAAGEILIEIQAKKRVQSKVTIKDLY
jgi:hypothetical protein